jgi:hypothetical protein
MIVSVIITGLLILRFSVGTPSIERELKTISSKIEGKIFDNIVEELKKSEEFSYYEQDKIVSNVFNFANFTRRKMNERGLDFEFLYVGTLANYSNNQMNVTLVNFLNKVIDATLSIVSWWNYSWLYRKQINITSTSGNLTDYQVPINITFISGKMNADFSDLRFTYYNFTTGAETEIPYWIESKVDSSWAYVWIKVPFLRNATFGNNTVYMYYGNPSATSKSDGDATFLFFDDFPGTSLNTTKWTHVYVGGNNDCSPLDRTTVSGSYLLLQGQADDQDAPHCDKMLYTNTNFSLPIAIDFINFRVPNWGGTGSAGWYRGVASGVADWAWTDSNTTHTKFDELGRNLTTKSAGTSSSSSDIAMDPTVYFNQTIIWLSNNVSWIVNSTFMSNLTTNVPSVSLPVILRVSHWGTTSYPSGRIDVDLVRVRKYTSPEPTYSIEEEEVTQKDSKSSLEDGSTWKTNFTFSPGTQYFLYVAYTGKDVEKIIISTKSDKNVYVGFFDIALKSSEATRKNKFQTNFTLS